MKKKILIDLLKFLKAISKHHEFDRKVQQFVGGVF